jgi:hypothetical protein
MLNRVGTPCRRQLTSVPGTISLLGAACATNDDVRVGIGGRGSGLLHVERRQPRDLEEDQSGILIGGDRYEIQGRSADVSVSVGAPLLQAIGGWEWSRKGNERFQAQLFGVRASLTRAKPSSGPYVIVLGRNVEGSGSRTPYFDGFDLGIGYEGLLRGPLHGDFCLSWAYVDGDAIRAGRDSISELRMAFGVRFEF